MSLRAALVADQLPAVFEQLGELGAAAGPALVLDLSAVERADSLGLAALADAIRELRQRGRHVQVEGVSPRLRRLADLLRFEDVLRAPPGAPPRLPWLERLGAWTLQAQGRLVLVLALLGTGYGRCLSYLTRGSSLGREQFWAQLVQVGLRATPIVALLNFTVGAVLAMQLAYVLRSYGAIQFIPQFVGLSITREIGPLLAAIIVAGRSGSAAAAEIGIMQVSEETDALRMMGVPPREFLLLPRFAALALAVPALGLVANLSGILGGAAVGVGSYGLGAASYYHDTVRALQLRDLGSGLIKSFFFGTIVAAVGVMQGLEVREGSEEVGRAATQAVVQAILAVILFDALFTAATRAYL